MVNKLKIYKLKQIILKEIHKGKPKKKDVLYNFKIRNITNDEVTIYEYTGAFLPYVYKFSKEVRPYLYNLLKKYHELERKNKNI